MKLYEDYLRLRNHYRLFPTHQEIDVTMDQLAEILFCSTRNAKLLLIKMVDQQWISFTPGVGRGKRSTLLFCYDHSEFLKMASQEIIHQGGIEEALEFVKNNAEDHLLEDLVGHLISQYFGFQSQKEQNQGITETLRMPIFREINTLDPAKTAYAFDSYMVRQIFSTLVCFDYNVQQLKPAIAHYWESEQNDSVWIFYLRKKVFFHDGRELTAEDVAFTLDRLSHSKSKWIVEDIEDLEVVHPYCLKIRLKSAHAFFPFLLSYPQASILSRNEALLDLPIGTGPYKVAKFTSEICILEAFEHYYEHYALLDRIEIYNFSGLQKQEFFLNDHSDLLLIDTEETKLLNPPKWEQKREISGTTLLTINRKKESPLQDPYLRKAIATLIPREKIVHDLGNLRIYPANRFRGYESDDHRDKWYHVEQGIEALSASEYQGEILSLYTYPRHKADAYWIKDHLEQYQIYIDVQIFPWKEMLEEKRITEADMILFEAVISEGTLGQIEYYTSDRSFIKQHLDQKTTSTISSMLKKAFAHTTTPDELQDILDEIEWMLLHDQSLILLTHKVFSTYIHPSLQSSALHFNRWVDFKDIWFKR